MAFSTLYLAAAVALLAGTVLANDCKEAISGNVAGSVYVNGGTCYLQNGAVINGSVYLKNGANLHTRGRVLINGGDGINGRSHGWVDIAGQTVVSQIDLFRGKKVSLYGVHVTKGELKVEGHTGDGVICGSSIASVVEWKENTGNLYVAKDWWGLKGLFGCNENKFGRDFKVEYLKGKLVMKDQEIERGELYVKGVSGTTELDDIEAGKVKVEGCTDEVYLYDVEAKEGEVKENKGLVKFYDTEFDKINCIGNGKVEGYDNEFKYAGGQCKGMGKDDDDDWFELDDWLGWDDGDDDGWF